MDKMFICPISAYGPGTICQAGTPSSQTMITATNIPCRAWIPPDYACRKASECPDVDTGPCGIDCCPNCVKVVIKEGFCRLINRER